MRLAERLRAIRAVADILAPMSEREADSILRLAGTNVTQSGWGGQDLASKRDDIISLLSRAPNDAALESLQELLSDEASSVSTNPREIGFPPDEALSIPAAMEASPTGPIFVVHGHARAVLHEAVRVLERGTEREVLVLHEQANAGRTILEKFEDYAAEASFAVVLLTGDDHGGDRAGDPTRLRGRQNVIFELGFFFGKLGRRRVAVLLEAGVEEPSNIDGLVYIEIDEHGGWKQALAKELETAGIPVNRSRIP